MALPKVFKKKEESKKMFIKIANNKYEAPVIYLRHKWKIFLRLYRMSSLIHSAVYAALSCSAKYM